MLEPHRGVAVDGYHDEFDLGSDLVGATVGSHDMGTIRIIPARPLADLPTGHILHRLPVSFPVDPDVLYAEPSRIGVLACYPDHIRWLAVLKLVAKAVNISAARSNWNYLLTMRGKLFGVINWLPWNLSEPFDYPAQEGGPIPAEPIWAATLNICELVRATKLFKPAAFDTMFPAGPPDWFDPSQVRPDAELSEIAERNQKAVRSFMARWRSGDPLPQLVAG